MALPLVKIVDSELVSDPAQPGITGCQFAYDDGRMCLDAKLQARNLCARHYQQLRRLGAFEQQRTARVDEALANVNADRLAKARDILQRASPHVARLWVKTAKVAVDKGDHKPAKDLLLHSGAITPIEKSGPSNTPSAFTVNIGVALAGVKSDGDK